MTPEQQIKDQKNGPGMAQQPQMPPQGQQIMLEPSDLEDVTCDCGCEYFDAVAKVKRLSPLHPKNLDRQERYFPLRVLVCKACGKEKQGINI